MFNALHIPEYIKPAIGGIGIGLIGLYSHDLFGVGYGEVPWISSMSIDQALVGQITLISLVLLFVLKIVATSLTLGSGGSGGIFAPSLFIGAMLGGAFGVIAHQLYPSYIAPSGAYSLVGMAAVLTGTTWAPITAIVMIFEMTRDYSIILPLMISVVISRVISRSLSRENIYTFKLVRRGTDIRDFEDRSPMRNITVTQVMTRNFPTVPPTMSVSELAEKLQKTGNHGYPVVDEQGMLQGIVTLTDVKNGISEGNPENLIVDDIASKSVIVAYPDQTLHDVLVKFGAREVGRIPVVDRSNPKRILGVLRRHDIIRAYTQAAAKPTAKM
jgi:CIC family chloride channel protein